MRRNSVCSRNSEFLVAGKGGMYGASASVFVAPRVRRYIAASSSPPPRSRGCAWSCGVSSKRRRRHNMVAVVQLLQSPSPRSSYLQLSSRRDRQCCSHVFSSPPCGCGVDSCFVAFVFCAVVCGRVQYRSYVDGGVIVGAMCATSGRPGVMRPGHTPLTAKRRRREHKARHKGACRSSLALAAELVVTAGRSI